VKSRSNTEKRSQRSGVGRARDTATVAISAAVLVICSWIAIPITPPISLQIFGILACAGILGFRRSVVACAVWVALGALGLPVFAAFGGSVGVLLGPSGGYIFGFVIASAIVGATSDRTERTLPLALAMTAGVAVSYLCGALWYFFAYSGGEGFAAVLGVCVAPFIVWDLPKLLLALVITRKLKKYI